VLRLRIAVTAMCPGTDGRHRCGGAGGPGAGQGRGDGQRGEPQNPLIPTNTNENNGGRIIDRLFAGLMSYDAHGNPTNEVARSIDTTDNVNFHITLQPDWKFTDRTPVTAKSFVDAWNYGALSTNGQLQQSFFSPIVGFDEVAGEKPTAQTMSGLAVLNDTEFTVRLKAPTIDFTQRLAFTPFYPLPQVAFADMAAFGRHPWATAPTAAGGDAWQQRAHRPGAQCGLPRQSPGPEQGPADGVLRQPRYRLRRSAGRQPGRARHRADQCAAHLPQGSRGPGDDRARGAEPDLDTPLRLDHFGGEEGRLRRLACPRRSTGHRSASRSSAGSRSPARDFTAARCPDSAPTWPATMRWTTTRTVPARCGPRPTPSRGGAASTSSPTTPTAGTRSGWTRWPTA
jgi:oligopeptide transport system substrate-binding protein